MTWLRSVAVAAAVAVAATLLTAGPAAAGAVTVTDKVGDSREAADLVALRVRHAEPPLLRRLVLRARHTGLPAFRTGTFTTVTFWIDTDPADPGPEFVSDVMPNTGGIALHRIGWWDRRGDTMLQCPGLRARADVFSDAPVTLNVPTACLGEPERVRAAVRSVGRTPDGDVTGRDWVQGRRDWSPWVTR